MDAKHSRDCAVEDLTRVLELRESNNKRAIVAMNCSPEFVQWKVMIKTNWSRPSGFRQEDFFLVFPI